MAYLMTHSLLSSWMFSLSENPYEDATTEADPMADFMRVLRREPTETTEAMQNGIEFEDLVTDIIPYLLPGNNPVPAENIRAHKWYEAAQMVASKCAGGVLQYKAKKLINLADIDILLYGRLDCLKAGTVYDIKFSKGYERGKYFESTQHPTYLELVPEAEQFTYLVSNGSFVWTETYRRDETGDIRGYIEAFVSWLKVNGLLDIYKEKWLSL